MARRNLFFFCSTLGLLSVLLSFPLFAQNPYLQPDRTWIRLKGTVGNAEETHFTLKYGRGEITVEMDDWDWYPEGRKLLPGSTVTVYGRVDASLYDLDTLEASAVYVEDLNTFFYANAVDEESLRPLTGPGEVSRLGMTGTVTGIEGRTFTLDTGARRFTVSTEEMSLNPLDDEGYQRIRKGDRVTVSGELKLNSFQDRTLMADSVVSRVRDMGKVAAEAKKAEGGE